MVTLRITREERGLKTIVRIEGRLACEGVEELRKTCDGTNEFLVLDVSHLQSADPGGIAALQALRAKGATVEGADGYIQLLLKCSSETTERGGR
jgi:hypothetical protein